MRKQNKKKQGKTKDKNKNKESQVTTTMIITRFLFSGFFFVFREQEKKQINKKNEKSKQTLARTENPNRM